IGAGGDGPAGILLDVLTPILAMAVAAATAMLILLRPRRLPEPLAPPLKLPPLPYAYACALSANAASFVLPVSNPANILVLAGAPMPILAFVQRLWLACLASAAVTLVGLLALTWTALDLAYVSQ